MLSSVPTIPKILLWQATITYPEQSGSEKMASQTTFGFCSLSKLSKTDVQNKEENCT